eukprot:1328640-Ditylum_brightwellii.AAC.1
MQFRWQAVVPWNWFTEENKTKQNIINDLIIADNSDDGHSFSPVEDLKTTSIFKTLKLVWLPCLS